MCVCVRARLDVRVCVRACVCVQDLEDKPFVPKVHTAFLFLCIKGN